ncbi:MAG: hypothetical protein H0T57_14405 [Rubrobacter sp.]|jgi:hypothetical protein|nr:hypothetical protein [Rubrobacter sp.]
MEERRTTNGHDIDVLVVGAGPARGQVELISGGRTDWQSYWVIGTKP